MKDKTRFMQEETKKQISYLVARYLFYTDGFKQWHDENKCESTV